MPAPRDPHRIDARSLALVAVAALVLLTVSCSSRPRSAGRASGAPATTATTATTTTTLPPPPDPVPHISRVETTDPVVFLTVDDGWHPLLDVLALLQSRHAPVTAFLIGPKAQRDADFYRQILSTGGTVENHSMTHRLYTKMPQAEQLSEICHDSDTIQNLFGRRPVLARPPFGGWDATVADSMSKCGIYVNVLWRVEVEQTKVTYDGVDGIQAGDIVLFHWGPSLLEDLRTMFALMDRKGLHAASLADYVGPYATHAPATAPASTPAAPNG